MEAFLLAREVLFHQCAVSGALKVLLRRQQKLAFECILQKLSVRYANEHIVVIVLTQSRRVVNCMQKDLTKLFQRARTSQGYESLQKECQTIRMRRSG